MDFFMNFHILGIMIPTDELIFFRGVGIPPTRLKVFPLFLDPFFFLPQVVKRLFMSVGKSVPGPSSQASAIWKFPN